MCAQMLSSVQNSNQQLTTSFVFNSSGELTSVAFPYGGSLAIPITDARKLLGSVDTSHIVGLRDRALSAFSPVYQEQVRLEPCRSFAKV